MKVHVIVETSETLSKRNHRRAANSAFRRTMEHHVTERMKRHFEENADTAPGGGYNYAPRSEKYSAWKQRRFGHRKPLVRFGNLMRRILSQGQSGVRATYKGATARLRHGLKFAKKIRRSELEAITRAEQKEVAAMIEATYIEESKKYPARKRETIT